LLANSESEEERRKFQFCPHDDARIPKFLGELVTTKHVTLLTLAQWPQLGDPA
jgi:hypothetical protein